MTVSHLKPGLRFQWESWVVWHTYRKSMNQGTNYEDWLRQKINMKELRTQEGKERAYTVRQVSTRQKNIG